MVSQRKGAQRRFEHTERQSGRVETILVEPNHDSSRELNPGTLMTVLGHFRDCLALGHLQLGAEKGGSGTHPVAISYLSPRPIESSEALPHVDQIHPNTARDSAQILLRYCGKEHPVIVRSRFRRNNPKIAPPASIESRDERRIKRPRRVVRCVGFLRLRSGLIVSSYGRRQAETVALASAQLLASLVGIWCRRAELRSFFYLLNRCRRLRCDMPSAMAIRPGGGFLSCGLRSRRGRRIQQTGPRLLPGDGLWVHDM